DLIGWRQRPFMSSRAGTWAASPASTTSLRWWSCALMISSALSPRWARSHGPPRSWQVMVFTSVLLLWSHRAVRVRQDGDVPDDESVTVMVNDDQLRDGFEAERPRLQRIASRILGDADGAQD